jgi:biotin synthase
MVDTELEEELTSNMDYNTFAEKSLQGKVLSREEMMSVLHAPDERLPELLQAAFRVRHHYFGKRVQIHVLMNAKSGLCPEDCHYCSQSSVSSASIDKYPLLDREKLVEGALKAKAEGAVRFCMVNSGRGPTDKEIAELTEVVREIKRRVPISICCSLGLLTKAKATALKEAGVERVNHNLNTSRHHYAEICETHTYEDRLETLKQVKAVGLSPCCGGILGMGDSEDDVLDLALALRELEAESIPVNFLHAIPGTPLEGARNLTPQYCLKALCLFRFVNPDREIRVAGGREVNLRSLQPLSLYPANSIFVNGYLTTPGQRASDAHRMIEDLGFEIDEGPSQQQ